MLNCSVVRDLLPNYLDGLTSEETNCEIEEHLAGCDECRAIKIAMSAEMNLETAREPKTGVRRKITLYKILGILAVIAIFLFIVWESTAYQTRYNINDWEILEQQLERYQRDVTVLKVEKFWNRTYVLYERNGEKEFGLMELLLHVDGTYGVISDTRQQGLTYAAFPVEVGRLNYVLVCGIQTLPDVARIQISGMTKDGRHTCYKGEAFEGPFIKVIPVKDDHRDLEIYYYDKENMPRTEDEILMDILGLDADDRLTENKLREYRSMLSVGSNPYTRSTNCTDGIFLDRALFDQILILGIAVVLVYVRYILYLDKYNRLWAWIPMGTFVILSSLLGNENLLFALVVLSMKLIVRKRKKKHRAKFPKQNV